MRLKQFHKFILLFLIFLIAFYYGDFGGQILAESAKEKGSNAFFQVSLALFAMFYIYFTKTQIKLPHKKIFFSYLLLLFILSFFRHNIIEDLRLSISIILTQFIILFLSTLMHKLRFADSLFYLVLTFIIVLWVCLFVHINSVGIISFAERNMYNRLGGLYFYGLTGTLAGLTVLLSGIGFFIDKSSYRKMFFAICIVNSLLFTLGSDLRNVLAASCICLILLFYLFSKRERYMKFVFVLALAGLILMGNYYLNHSEAASTTDSDLGVREMIWAWTYDGISKQPIIGYGKVNYFATNLNSMIFQDELSDPHSSILNLTLKFGIPATLLFLFYFAKLMIYNYKRDRIFKGSLLVIPLYWFLSTITGGTFFIGNGYFGSYIFGLSMFGIFLHPQLFYKNIPIKIKKVIDVTSLKSQKIIHNREL